MDGDGAVSEPSAIPALFHFAHFES